MAENESQQSEHEDIEDVLGHDPEDEETGDGAVTEDDPDDIDDDLDLDEDDLDEDDLDEDDIDTSALGLDDDDDSNLDDDDDDDDEDEDGVEPARKPADDDEEDDDDEVEADLDAILKDRLDSGDDEDEDEEDDDGTPVKKAPPPNPDAVAAKAEDEKTCESCWLIKPLIQFPDSGSFCIDCA